MNRRGVKLTVKCVFIVWTLMSITDGANIVEVTENKGKGQSMKSFSPERAVGLSGENTLKVKAKDAQANSQGNFVVKYKQLYKNTEVFGFGVTLEYDKRGLWTANASGLIATGLAVKGTKKSRDEAKNAVLKRAGFDSSKQFTNYDETKPTEMYYVDTSDQKRGNRSRIVLCVNFLVLKDKSKLQKVPVETVPTDKETAPSEGVPTRGKRAANSDSADVINPQALVDLITGEVVAYQDDLMSIPYEKRGYGGNRVIGRHQYGNDEWAGRWLKTDRETPSSNCRMRNSLASVSSAGSTWVWPPSACFPAVNTLLSPFRESCFISGSIDSFPTGVTASAQETYSQVHDALYYSTTFIEMLQTVYSDTTLQTNCGGQVKLCPHFGVSWDNAFYFDGGNCETYYGDGNSLFYGLASAKVVGHELGHAIVRHTSGLHYSCQSGGMNEAFADITGLVFKAFLDGHDTNWMMGDEMMRNIGWRFALRFMSDPPKDGRSIDCTRDYSCGNGVHYNSGIYNKAFYNLVKMEHWCMRKAYEVFLRATKLYWHASTGYDEGLCGLIRAAYDLGYRADDLREAFAKVGVFCGCPKGWITRYEFLDNFPHGRRTTCYKLVRDAASWAEARVYCNSMESDLVRIEDQSEHSFLQNYMTWWDAGTWAPRHHLVEKSEYWIGAMDMSTESIWRWIPQDLQTSYTNWRSGEPNNFQKVQNCAALRSFTSNSSPSPTFWKWVDDDCYQKKYFICERSCCGKACRNQ